MPILAAANCFQPSRNTARAAWSLATAAAPHCKAAWSFTPPACDGLAAGWATLPADIHAEVGARLASTGALRSLDAALRLVAQHGTVAHLHTVSRRVRYQFRRKQELCLPYIQEQSPHSTHSAPPLIRRPPDGYPTCPQLMAIRPIRRNSE